MVPCKLDTQGKIQSVQKFIWTRAETGSKLILEIRPFCFLLVKEHFIVLVNFSSNLQSSCHVPTIKITSISYKDNGCLVFLAQWLFQAFSIIHYITNYVYISIVRFLSLSAGAM